MRHGSVGSWGAPSFACLRRQVASAAMLQALERVLTGVVDAAGI
ncbi:hypothetical protein LA76x_0613 [Lysobacter antibioticus]|uniref:Uncharacterized protein n=1 Tax=Lysobacter antibioticus TaxID=84531 RepID=A0A0S2F5F5_LYSAN|nr:hypothetical protein LA76x_0613 [Lysobacter antibioticus]